ncbi:MAG: hypothetical protein C6P37_04610 [Caldibacillus debilis]|uniref:Uncharacterized protein n=1 Tax=Caldibacillus debilis TaxID=301148 RepID=A0A3E0K686_9BACI|nr:MAG: hypothetical protein C6W57_04660 [Caldibacillus debilis]REJ29737.1 MAG: hypothetical protein C6P37_04610 [Caldibacillus debilis]
MHFDHIFDHIRLKGIKQERFTVLQIRDGWSAHSGRDGKAKVPFYRIQAVRRFIRDEMEVHRLNLESVKKGLAERLNCSFLQRWKAVEFSSAFCAKRPVNLGKEAAASLGENHTGEWFK